MAARAKVRHSKTPTQSATHQKRSHCVRTLTSRTRGKAGRRRSTQCKATRRKIRLRKPSLSKHQKATENNAIQNEDMKHNVKSDQSKVIKGKEGACFFLWRGFLLSAFFLVLKVCGLNFVWHTIHCYLRFSTEASSVSDRKEYVMMRKKVSCQLAVGGLKINGSSLLPVLSFLLVLVQMLLMLCGDVKPNPGPTPITMDELDEVVKTLLPIQHKWLELGGALHIPQQTLNVLSRHCSPDDCLKAVLHEWIQLKDSILTWETLSEAVASVGEKDLSQWINHQYLAVSSSSQQRGMIFISTDSPHFLAVSLPCNVPHFSLLLCCLLSSLLQTTLVTVISLLLSAKLLCLNR